MSAQNSIASLNQNNLKGALNANGLLFDSANSIGLSTQRNNALFKLIKSAGIWISATDSLGNLHLAAHNINGNNHDFWPGPIDIQNGQSANPLQWNKVYPISKNEINFHKQNYKKGGYVASSNIINWPGSSSTNYLSPLAPFVDVTDNNKIYEPIKGDYPYINSDALVYSIYNDNFASHSYSNGLPLGVEIHTSLYAFNSNDSFLQNAVLARHIVYNRSQNNYKNFRFSNVINFNIGNIENEYLGTDVGTKTLFTINDTNEATFKNGLVSMGCMLINKPLNSTMYFKNSTDPIYGNPTNAIEFNHLMQGKWKNGKQLTYGSEGIDGVGKARFVFPYTSDNDNGNLLWSEQSSGTTSAGNRLGIMNTDSIKLNKGKFEVYDFVYFFVEKNNHDTKQINTFCRSLLNKLEDKNILKNNKNLILNTSKINIYPNPASRGEKITFDKTLENTCKISLIDNTGKVISEYNLDKNENSINLPRNLESGIYFLNIKTLNTNQIEKINIF